MSSPQVSLRRATLADLDAILALERATDHAPHWPPAAYREILESFSPGCPPDSIVIVSGAENPPISPVEATHSPNRRDALDAPAAEPPSAAIQRCLFVAEKDARIAGFAVGLLHPSPTPSVGSPDATAARAAELESVAISLDARRSGIGQALCRAVLDWCREQGATEVILEVRATSADAVALYAGLGFTLIGRRPRYYREPDDDALLLQLHWT